MIEVSCSRDKHGFLPRCKDNETWTDQDISSYLPDNIKMMMCRNEKYNLLVRHFDSNVSVENFFANELGLTVQRAMKNGYSIDELIRSLDAEKKSLKGMLSSDVGSLTIGGLSSEQVYHNNIYQDYLNNLKGALHGDELPDQLSGSGRIDDIF